MHYSRPAAAQKRACRPAYHNREFELHPGDCVFVFTDGVPEANNTSGEMFGEERLLKTLNRHTDTGPEALVRHVHDAVDRFVENTTQFDDITMLCFRYDGPQQPEKLQ